MRGRVIAWLIGAALTTTGVTAQTNTFPASGNVGIGTTGPGANLDVQVVAGQSTQGIKVDDGTQWLRLFPNLASANWNSIVQAGDAGIIFGNGASGLSIAPWASTTSGIRITSGGRVGIGKAVPDYLLDVAGPIHTSTGGVVFPDGSVQTTAYSQQGVFQVGNGSTSTLQALYVDGNLNGGTVQAPSQGAWIEWNNLSGMTAFVNNQGSGAGGWEFINTNASGTPLTTPMVIQGNGDVGIGTPAPVYTLDVTGQIHTTGGIVFPGSSTAQTTPWTGVLCGGDYAEAMKAAGEKKSYEPGDVLVLTDDAKSDVQKSAEPYSTMVAGIYATQPGVIGKRQSLKDESTEVPMAMVGVVPTKVIAENGAIHRGDLLVSSSVPGYAMKGTDRSRLVGAVIGKAMGSLDSGNGVIEVLVTLQ
jgi:hypothetical protein